MQDLLKGLVKYFSFLRKALQLLKPGDILHKLSPWAPAETFQNIIERGTNMKEGIHPGYKECKVTCACGTHSLQASRSLLTEAAVLRSSRTSTVSSNNRTQSRSIAPAFFFAFFRDPSRLLPRVLRKNNTLCRRYGKICVYGIC